MVLVGNPVFAGVNGGKLEAWTIAGIEAAVDDGQSAMACTNSSWRGLGFFGVRSFDFERAELAAGNGDDRFELNGPDEGSAPPDETSMSVPVTMRCWIYLEGAGKQTARKKQKPRAGGGPHLTNS